MPTLTLETQIAAPVEVCFDLARDVETHLAPIQSTPHLLFTIRDLIFPRR